MRLILQCLFVCLTTVVILATENNTKEPTPATSNEKLTSNAGKADAKKSNADEINAEKNANKEHASKSRRNVNQHSVPSPQKLIGLPPTAQPLSVLKGKCFVCYDCPKVFKKNTANKQCPYCPDPNKQSTCITYTEYNVRKPVLKFVVRGCAAETGSCKELKASREIADSVMQIASCVECQGDFCNSTSKSLPGMFLGILMLVTTSLVKKHIAS